MLTGDSKAWFCVLPVCVMLKHSLPHSPKFSFSWNCQSTTTFKEERRLSCRGMFFLILKAEASHGTSGAPAFSLSLDRESRSASLPTWQAALLLEHSPCPPFLCPSQPCPWSGGELCAPAMPHGHAVLMDKMSSFVTLSRNQNVICNVWCKMCSFFCFFF